MENGLVSVTVVAKEGKLCDALSTSLFVMGRDGAIDFWRENEGFDARPELATHTENPDSYDVIFLGFPNWNADLPMPLYTFLEEYDFGGKTIIPFTTHGGSGFSRNIQIISELQPDAEVISEGLSVSRDSVPGAKSEVIDWVNGLDLSSEG